jgi:gliding motility-associated-like protein
MKSCTNRIIWHKWCTVLFSLFVCTLLHAQTISMADGYCYIICPDGTVSAMGNNNYGQLGDGTYFNKSTPVKVKHLDNVVAVSAPGVMALKDDGTVWRWSWQGEYRMQKIDISDVVAINSCHRFMGSQSFAIKRDGTLWTWTNNYGHGDIEPENPIPQLVPGISDVVSIKCSSTFGVIMALCGNGSVYIWGTCPDIITPSGISLGSNVKEVATGSGTYFFLRNDGTVWYWGWMSSGTCSIDNPRQIDISNVRSIYVMQTALFMIKNDGTLWAWGHSSDFLGTGGAFAEVIPQQVIGIKDVAEVSTDGYSGSTTLARTTDGSVWGWGYNHYGELGDSTNNRKPLAEKIAITCPETDCYAKYPYPITVRFDTIVEIGAVIDITASPSQLYNWQYSWHDWEEWYENQQTFRVNMENEGHHMFASLIDSNGCYRYEQFNIYSICDTLIKVKDKLMLDTTLVPGSHITLTASEAESYFWYPWSTDRTNSLIVDFDIESVATLTDETGCERTERFMLRTACDKSTLANPAIVLDTITYIGNALTLSSSPGAQIMWQPNTGLSCTDCFDPNLQITGPKTYVATITDLYNCLRKEAFIIRIADCDTIVQNENLVILDTLIQPGTPLQLNASEAQSYKWDPESGLSCYDCKSPIADDIVNTIYTVTLTDEYNCHRTEQFSITNDCDNSTLMDPLMILDTITYPLVVIPLHARNAENYAWTGNSGLSCTDCQDMEVTVNSPMELTVTSTDRYGCVFKEKFSIKIRDCDTIVSQEQILKMDTIINYPSDIELNVSESFNGYTWNSMDALSCSDCPNPVLHARSTATYIVELFDMWHCAFREEFRITVLYEDVVIPNVISPNGDGINDVFEISGLIPGTTLDIFDDNGIVVYHTKNYPNDWNGRKNGELLTDGTYWYILTLPGMKTYKGWVYVKSK